MDFPTPPFHAIVVELQDTKGQPIVFQPPSIVGIYGSPAKLAITSTCAIIRDSDGYDEIFENLTSVAKDHLSEVAIDFKDSSASSMLSSLTLRSVQVAWGGGLRASDAAVTQANCGAIFKAIIDRKCVDVLIVQMEPTLEEPMLKGCTSS